MYQPEGLRRLWEIVTGEADDSLQGGTLVVSDGTQEASVTIDEFPYVQVFDGQGDGTSPGGEAPRGTARLSISATFGSDVANFTWAERRVVTREGVVLDIEAEDGGRKAPGSEWTLYVELDLLPTDVG